MTYSRTQFDLQNYNPLLKDVFYELEEPKRDDKYALQPRRMRTHILKRIPIMYDEPPNSQPKFRWVTSEWHFANPTPEMKKWNEKYRSSLGRMQGSNQIQTINRQCGYNRITHKITNNIPNIITIH